MAQRLSQEQIQEMLDGYRGSGLTQIEYCRRTGTVLSTLGRYLRQNRNPEQQFVRVKMETMQQPDGGFVLVLGNGRRVASDWAFKDAELARLIRVVETA